MSNDRYQEIRQALAMGSTPGPWNVEKCRYGFAVYGSKTGDIVVKTEDAEGRYGAIDNEADARLIAAAPELLEALQDLMCLAEVAMREAGEYDIEAELADARAAIAKAKGEVK